MDIHWIDHSFPGSLGIATRPRGGDWLEAELARARTQRLDVLVSLLEPAETAELELTAEERFAAEVGIRFLSFPIHDRSVPSVAVRAVTILRGLLTQLQQGNRIAVHCRQGIGRSALVCASLLVLGGVAPEDAWEAVERARGTPVPDTPEQRGWVHALARGA
jgi:protein-tyrosine phosphatase